MNIVTDLVIEEAISNKNIEKLKSILNSNFYDNKNLEKCFVVSAMLNETDLFKLCIEKGVDITAKNNIATFLACKNANFDIFNLLLTSGLDIHDKNNKLLYHAAYYGCNDFIKILISKGIDINMDGSSALYASIEYNKYKTVKLLIKNGINIHTNNNEALIKASKFGNDKIVKLLLENGAIIQNKKIASVLFTGNNKCLDILISYGFNYMTNNCILLTRAKSNKSHDMIERIFTLIKGSKLANRTKNNAIYWCVKNDDFELFKIIVHTQNDIKYINYHIKKIIEFESINCLRYLLESIDLKFDIYFNILKWAVFFNKPIVIDHLLKNIRDIHENNDMLLKYAIRTNFYEYFKKNACFTKLDLISMCKRENFDFLQNNIHVFNMHENKIYELFLLAIFYKNEQSVEYILNHISDKKELYRILTKKTGLMYDNELFMKILADIKADIINDTKNKITIKFTELKNLLE